MSPLNDISLDIDNQDPAANVTVDSHCVEDIKTSSDVGGHRNEDIRQVLEARESLNPRYE